VFSATFPLSADISFVFINIHAWLRAVERRPFVFIEIPASFPFFKVTAVRPLRGGGDILCWGYGKDEASRKSKIPSNAVGSRQSAVARRKKAIHHSQIRIAAAPAPVI
jgi:hypothetical protein